MVTLEEVKLYLKVDFTDDDQVIQQMLDASELYLYNLTGKTFENSQIVFELMYTVNPIPIFTKFEERLAKIYIKAMVAELYSNRTITCEKAQKTVYILNSILNQLRYC